MCEPPGTAENNWVLMRVCWRYWNKFGVFLVPSGLLDVFKHSFDGHWFMSSLRINERLSQLQAWCLLLGWLFRHLGYPCMGMCVQVCVHLCEEKGRSQGELHTAPMSGYLCTTDVGTREIWSSAQQQVLGSLVDVYPRECYASSEGGCGCHRVSAQHTAPFEHRRALWRGSLVVHYCR